METFLQVAQHRGFRRAAAALDVTPSAVSHAIRALEARSVVATTPGVFLYHTGRRQILPKHRAFMNHFK